MQDVTRLLYILNKRRSLVAMPPDGLQLLNWSEQILDRYLSSQVRKYQQHSSTDSIISIIIHVFIYTVPQAVNQLGLLRAFQSYYYFCT